MEFLMKKLLFYILISSFLYSTNEEPFVLGEETIDPIRFSKFHGAYGHGFVARAGDAKSFSEKVASQTYYSVSVETNLYHYMNAGARVNYYFDKIEKKSLVKELEDYNSHKRFNFSLFAKPFLPLTTSIALYGILEGGFGVNFVSSSVHIRNVNVNYEKLYGDSFYQPFFIPLLNASLGLGVEYFFLPRWGIFIESSYIAGISLLKKTKIEGPLASVIEVKNDKGPASLWLINQSLVLSGGVSFVF